MRRIETTPAGYRLLGPADHPWAEGVMRCLTCGWELSDAACDSTGPGHPAVRHVAPCAAHPEGAVIITHDCCPIVPGPVAGVAYSIGCDPAVPGSDLAVVAPPASPPLTVRELYASLGAPLPDAGPDGRGRCGRCGEPHDCDAAAAEVQP